MKTLFCISALFFILFPISRCPGQELYLRLTDYGGGKIALVFEPFSVIDASEHTITLIKNIEFIVKNDLEYSLYFELVTDSNELSKKEEQAILIQGKGDRQGLSLQLIDFMSKETIAQKNFEVQSEVRSLAHRISDYIITTITGEKGIASTKIAFSYKTDTGKELALIDYDGFNFTGLTRNGKFNLFPAWAPDSRRILFSSHTRDRFNVYLFDLVKRKITTICSFHGLNFAPCWSPDASKICLTLTKDGNAEIYMLDLHTKKLDRLTHNRAIDTSPTFSPNSREIAFVSDRSGNPQVYIMDIYGGNVRRLTYHGNYNTSPAWSPRGDLIVYVSREKDNSQQIYITDPYDFSPIQLTFEGNNEEPSWSPDGLHIVFSSNRSGQYELYTMNWDGSRKRKLTSGLIANAPDWSPIIEQRD